MARRVRLGAAAVLGAVLLGSCGSASEPSPPTGVDELVIPSPSLDPTDFVDEVGNPWLPLAPGSEWVYRASVRGTDRLTTVTVLDETREIQGVAATAVRTTEDGGRSPSTAARVDWYAQDTDGNVWHLGQEGRWEAGVGGAQAGLAMPARPRVGDGFRTEYAEGVAEGRAQVVTLDGSASVPYGDLTELLETEVSTPLEPGVVERRLYARDVGLVREVTVAGGEADVQLVRYTAG